MSSIIMGVAMLVDVGAATVSIVKSFNNNPAFTYALNVVSKSM